MDEKVMRLVLLLGLGLVELVVGSPWFGDKCELPESCTFPLYCEPSTKVCTCRDGRYDNNTETCVNGYYSRCSETGCPSNLTCTDVSNKVHLPESVDVHLQKKDYSYVMRNIYPDDTFCLCKPRYEFDILKKKCIPALQYNEACSDKIQKEQGRTCDSRLLLTCGPKGTCICADNETVYESEVGCAVPLGGNCTSETQCTQNAWCCYTKNVLAKYDRNNHYYYHYEDERRMAWMNRGKIHKCECIIGYQATPDGKCLPDYHVECSKKSPCYHKSLGCINGICQCRAGLNSRFMKFENSAAECYALEGAACSKDSPTKCAPHSTCVKGRCNCDTSLVANTAGRCHLSHGRACTPPYTANGSIHIPEPYCNQVAALACVDGKCACVDSGLKWNAKTHRCEAEEGGRCGVLDLSEVEDRKLSPVYPLHPFVSDNKLRRGGESQVHFQIYCEDGLKCVAVADAEYILMPRKCTKIKKQYRRSYH